MDKKLISKLLKADLALGRFATGLYNLGFEAYESELGNIAKYLEDAILDLFEVPEDTWNDEDQTGFCRDGYHDEVYDFKHSQGNIDEFISLMEKDANENS